MIDNKHFCYSFFVLVVFLSSCSSPGQKPIDLPNRDIPLTKQSSQFRNNSTFSVTIPPSPPPVVPYPILTIQGPGNTQGFTFKGFREINSGTAVIAVTNGNTSVRCGIYLSVIDPFNSGHDILGVYGDYGFNTSYVNTCLFEGETGYAAFHNGGDTNINITTIAYTRDNKGQPETFYDLGKGIKPIKAVYRNSEIYITLKNENLTRTLYLCESEIGINAVIGFDVVAGIDVPIGYEFILVGKERRVFAPSQERELPLYNNFKLSGSKSLKVYTNYAPFECTE